ncbi:MAG: M48 family metallopeptidase, partial [Candidatus Acidiferrum sp.]
MESAIWTAVGVLLTAGAAFSLSQRTVRLLRKRPDRRDEWLTKYQRWRWRHRLLLLGTYVMALLVLGWGGAVRELWQGAGTGQWPFAEFVVLAPFLASLLLSWFCFYDADKAAHQTGQRIFGLDPLSRGWLEQQAVTHPTTEPFGDRLSYVLFHLRQKLALVLIPLTFLLVFKEFRRLLPDVLQHWAITVNIASTIGVLAVFLSMPWFVRFALGLRPVPAGVPRDRLMATARRLGFRFSDILLWPTRGAMANAMVIGLLPWPRYVVFTDRLLDDFSAEEVEAVLGHEIGHIKHFHIPFYLIFLTTSLVLLWIGMEHLHPAILNSPLLRQWIDFSHGQSFRYLQMLPTALLLLAYVLFVFGFISRRCERQADIFGCRAVSCAEFLCAGHQADAELAVGGNRLCVSGIRTFISALERVAVINGISRDRPGFLQSWQHGTIAKRVDFLQRIVRDEKVEKRFQKRLLIVKCAIVFAMILLLGLAVSGDIRQDVGAFGDHGDPGAGAVLQQ